MTRQSLRLSQAQLGLLFDAATHADADFHVTLQLRIDPLAPDRLRAAVEAVIAEQPALRARLEQDGGAPRYRIETTAAAPLETHDLRDRLRRRIMEDNCLEGELFSV